MSDERACTVDAERMIEYLDAPAADPAFLAHVLNCRRCRLRLLQMGAAGMSDAIRRGVYNHVDDLLPEFAAAHETDETDAARFAAVRLHLLFCQRCYADFRDLVSGFSEAAIADAPPSHGQEAAHSGYRPPDLAFLKPTRGWRFTTITEGMAQPVRALRLNLGLLFQSPRLALGATRTGAGERKRIEDTAPQPDEVSLGAEMLDGLDVRLRLIPCDDDATLAVLEVRAMALSLAAEGFAGMRVILRWPDGSSLDRVTDDAGLARFAPLPKTDLQRADLDILPPSPGGPSADLA